MRTTLLIVPVVLLLAGCTAASPAATPPPVKESAAPVAVGTAGIYDVDFGQFAGVYTLLDDGEFYGLHFLGDTLAGQPHGQLSPDNTALAKEPIAWANFVDDGRRVGSMEKAGVFGRTFSDTDLTAAISGSMGSFSAKATAQKAWEPGSGKSLYLDPIGDVSGSYTGNLRTVGIQKQQEAVKDLRIDGDSFTVEASGCTFEGTLTPYQSTGVFRLTATTSGADCLLQPELSGIVTPLSVVDGVPQLAFQLDSADATQAAVFIVTRG